MTRRTVPFVVLPLLAACYDPLYGVPLEDGETGWSEDAAAEAVEEPSYERDIAPIWEQSCAGSGCHLDGGVSGGLALDDGDVTLVGVWSSQVPELPLVEPYDETRSYLWKKLIGEDIEGVAMPMGGTLDNAELATIRNWIQRGAQP